MHSDDHPDTGIRPMASSDRAAIASLIVSVDSFNKSEVDCALELVDIYLHDYNQTDYRVIVAEDSTSRVHAYACWGTVPITRGTYDLYWIATHTDSQGRGFGHALMAYVEEKVLENRGRLLVVETSAKSSYARTVMFYQRPGYEETSRISDFYDVGDDRLIFVKRLS
jgi:ribosomal protein S18 acetylase RimI-like enzyme